MRQILQQLAFIIAPIIIICVSAQGSDEAKQSQAGRVIRVITLGDSITKGVRAGVSPDQTFSAILQKRSAKAGIQVEVLNLGIGGERTDQALARLDRDVIAQKPDIVTVMYGTNDSYVDIGKTAPRLSTEQFEANLGVIVERLKARKIRVILMTEPRWGSKARPNGLGEPPNQRLEPYMQVTRDVAKRQSVPLVDHYQDWFDREKHGLNLSDVTTDECHPNPAGHVLLADALWPVLQILLKERP